MALALLRRGESVGLLTALLRTALWMGLCGVVTGQTQTECPPSTCRTPPDSFTTKHSVGDTPSLCYRYGTTLSVHCQIGFLQSNENDFIAMCDVDGTWEWSDSCTIDIFSVIIAAIAAFVAIFAFFLIMFCILRRRKPALKDKNGKQKMMYETEEETA